MKRLSVRAYTLIELLVVISIILILAGILFPVLRSSRESARRTQCLTNQKNIGVYIHNYAFNNDRKLDVLSNWKYWYRDMLYANGGFKNDEKPNDHYLVPDSKTGEYKYLTSTGLEMAKVFRCPSDVSLKDGALASYGRNDPKAGGTLKYKTGTNGSSRNDALADRLVDSRMNDINNPSDLILTADHWGKIHRPGESDDSEEYESNNIYHLRLREGDKSIGTEIERDDVSRHRGTPPILFVDGHMTATDWKTSVPPRFYDLLKSYGGSDGLGWQGRAVGSWSDSPIVKK